MTIMIAVNMAVFFLHVIMFIISIVFFTNFFTLDILDNFIYQYENAEKLLFVNLVLLHVVM